MSKTALLNPLILVAEDDPDDALILKDAFLEINLPCPKILENGKLLIDYLNNLLANNELPQFIVIDLNMPILDGRGVLKALKKNSATSKIPVIVLSTTKSVDDIEALRKLGANDFYTKPSSFAELVKIAGSMTQKWL